MQTYSPLDPNTLNAEQCAEDLAPLMFLVENPDGRTKSRSCIDGSKQRRIMGYKKEDSASPTVSNDGLMIRSAIEAHEKRHVACIDMLGAYLHALTDEEEIMLLRGPLNELMAMFEPKLYRKFVTHDNKGVELFYVKMNKALYGLLKNDFLFYKKLVEHLEAYGFNINPYDSCVANKIINGKKMTVKWLIDDLKVSHQDAFEITIFCIMPVRHIR